MQKNVTLSIRSLTFISIAFLTIPTLMFVIGWLKPLLSISIILTTTVLYYNYSSKYNNHKVVIFNYFELFFLFSISFLWLLFSGTGGFGYQLFDYEKHNSILKELTVNEFPIIYKNDTTLVYYLGYYLPSILLAKITNSFVVVNSILFVWTYFGLLLSLTWIVYLIKGNKFLTIILFISVYSLDVIGFISKNLLVDQKGIVDIFKTFYQDKIYHIDWWASYFCSSSNTSLLYYSPQHALAGWLGTSMLIDGFFRKDTKLLALIPCLIFFWSPFIVVGFTPFFIFYLFNKNILRTDIIPYILYSLLLLSVFYFFYQSNSSPEATGACFIFDCNLNTTVGYLVSCLAIFVTIKILIPILIVNKFVKKDMLWNQKNIFLLIVMILGISTIKLGYYNDLFMRFLIPPTFFILIYFIRGINSILTTPSQTKVFFLSIYFILSAFSTFLFIQNSVEMKSNIKMNPRKLDEIKNISQIAFKEQYIGHRNSFFFKYLAKTTEK